MNDDWDDDNTDYLEYDSCPVCGNYDTIVPYGRKDSKVLIIGDAPGDDDIKKGIPFAGATGHILKYELAYCGIDLNSIRRCGMWIHKLNKNPKCKEYGIEVTLKEAKGKKLILLIGSKPVKFFTGEKVSDVNGLELKSDYLSAPVIACLQPTTIFKNKGTIGELRFALEYFAKRIQEMQLL